MRPSHVRLNALEKVLSESAFQLSVASCVARQKNLPIKRELATAKEAVAEALELLQQRKSQ